MNKLTLVTLILLLSFSSHLVSQISTAKKTAVLSHLEIISTNDNFISIHTPGGLNSNTIKDIKESLQSFRSHLDNFESKLPDYEFYSIDYVDGIKLEISEVIGKEIYQLSDDDKINIKSSNTFTLTTGKNKVIVLFSDIEELRDEQLIIDIDEASTALLNKKKKIRKGLIQSLDTYRYDSKKKSSNAIENESTIISFRADLEFNGTYVRERFFYDFKTPIYIGINKLPKYYLGAIFNYMHFFSTSLEEQITTTFTGVGIGRESNRNTFGQVYFLWKTTGSDLFGNTKTKLGISEKRKKINYGVDWYNPFQDDSFLALSVGYSF